MGFMQPVVYGPEPVYIVEDIHGGSYIVPESVEDLSTDEDGNTVLRQNGDSTEDPYIVERADLYRPESNMEAARVEHAGVGYVARMSAPGYMDCTEWEGPFGSVQEAMVALEESFELCAVCGGDLDEDYACESCDKDSSSD